MATDTAKKADTMQTVRIFTVVPELPARLEGLRRLAYNLWWTWNTEAIGLFQRLDTPASAAETILDNALSASEYATAPDGEGHLVAIREQVMAACYPEREAEPPAWGGDFV